jgi:hypothetical protein
MHSNVQKQLQLRGVVEAQAVQIRELKKRVAAVNKTATLNNKKHKKQKNNLQQQVGERSCGLVRETRGMAANSRVGNIAEQYERKAEKEKERHSRHNCCKLLQIETGSRG